MRVVLAHNRYTQQGGEDMVFAAEAALLRRFGHEVIEFVKDNKDIGERSRASLLKTTIWSRECYAELTELLRSRRPDLLHLHNTLPLISPAAAHAAKAQSVATVQTLHNYRLLCPSAVMFRDGRPCMDCVGKRFAWPGVLHACYRQSRAATAAVACMTAVHRHIGTWSDKIDVHIALTQSSREKFITGGLPADKILVKPNFLIRDPGPGKGGGGFALFAGRLSTEKGIATLLAAWRTIQDRLPLVIVGDGPMRDAVAAATAQIRGVTWLGERSHEDVLELMGRALALVIPSEWYEPFGLVIIEAFARGTPVIGADIGSIGEIVEQGESGYLYRPGEPADLVAKVHALIERPDEALMLRDGARRAFEERYTAERNYQLLIRIYERALEANRGRPASRP
jgi:glycosyltransferase involved in cell wall biosynthesis